MSLTVRPAPPEHYPWLLERAGLNPSLSLLVYELWDGRRILGQVGYDQWTQTACAMHVALAHPAAARHLLRPAFHVAFAPLDQGGRARVLVVAQVASTNERSLAFTRHLGFREVFRGRDWFRLGVDMVWHEMRAAECRYWSPVRRAA